MDIFSFIVKVAKLRVWILRPGELCRIFNSAYIEFGVVVLGVLQARGGGKLNQYSARCLHRHSAGTLMVNRCDIVVIGSSTWFVRHFGKLRGPMVGMAKAKGRFIIRARDMKILHQRLAKV
jgi:hypothetical protein